MAARGVRTRGDYRLTPVCILVGQLKAAGGRTTSVGIADLLSSWGAGVRPEAPQRVHRGANGSGGGVSRPGRMQVEMTHAGAATARPNGVAPRRMHGRISGLLIDQPQAASGGATITGVGDLLGSGGAAVGIPVTQCVQACGAGPTTINTPFVSILDFVTAGCRCANELRVDCPPPSRMRIQIAIASVVRKAAGGVEVFAEWLVREREVELKAMSSLLASVQICDPLGPGGTRVRPLVAQYVHYGADGSGMTITRACLMVEVAQARAAAGIAARGK
mmetsp:Transcript_5511/g.9836  ORF Transcript_5511/g.9836 Transcript_5511/m.9836 type:complete len:276 (-) Transcript_5511:2414-3241(-)